MGDPAGARGGQPESVRLPSYSRATDHLTATRHAVVGRPLLPNERNARAFGGGEFRLPLGESMAKITGIGGVFFKSTGDHKALAAWYQKHLGMPLQPWGGAALRWPEDRAEYQPSPTTVSIGGNPLRPWLVTPCRNRRMQRTAMCP